MLANLDWHRRKLVEGKKLYPNYLSPLTQAAEKYSLQLDCEYLPMSHCWASDFTRCAPPFIIDSQSDGILGAAYVYSLM
jgi:hypothetical protein